MEQVSDSVLSDDLRPNIFDRDRGDFEMTHEQLKKVIRCVHKGYYTGDFLESRESFMMLHSHLSILFNYAGITETLCKNNPKEMRPKDFLMASIIEYEKTEEILK